MKKHTVFVCYLFALFSQGHAGSSPDIVNGQDAKPEQIPYQIALENSGRYICSGTILNEYYVLTAGHCVDRYANAPRKFFPIVVVGTNNLNESREVYAIDKVILHEQYSISYLRNDIALLKMEHPFKFNSKIQPVTLAKAHSAIPAGSPVQVSGWGSRSEGQEDTSSPKLLQTVTVYVADQDFCREIIKNKTEGYWKVYSKTVCAYNPNETQGPCDGDSGGPLMLNGTQVGIVSYTVLYCGDTEVPAVYTRVPEYIDWIKKRAK